MSTVHAYAPHPVAVPWSVVPPRRHSWRVLGDPGHPVAAALRGDPGAAATATAVLLGARFAPADNARLLEGIADATRHGRRLVLVHAGAGGGALLRSTMARGVRSRLTVQMPPNAGPAAVRSALRLVTSDVTGDVEVRDDGGRYRTSWRSSVLPAAWSRPPAPGVAVVTGGLGGLGLRVAAVLSHRYGLHPILIDGRPWRTLPTRAAALLSRLVHAPAGATVRTADLTDPAAVVAALSDPPGRIVAVLHCAGALGPPGDCGPDDLAAVQAVKVAGLRNVLAALDPAPVRHLVTFGSVLAEEPAHNLGCYALANELLRRATTRAAATVPHATTVTAEWSVWAGAGMAHELGVVPQARRAGITPVALRPGLRTLTRLLALPPGPHHAHVLLLKGAPTGGGGE
jgi:NAD(P)-dependent dehydrogenase (short-subunit alcohol dehydrogenase family)